MLNRRMMFTGVATTLAFPSRSAEISLPVRAPLVAIDHPDDWTVSQIRRGSQAHSPDKEVFLWFEVYLPNEYNTVQREHDSYFRQQGLALKPEPKRSAYRRGDFQVRSTIFDGTWRGQPNVLIYLVYELGTPLGHQLLLTYWASQTGHTRHDAAMKSIVDSIRMKQAG